ncbi:zinc finger protein [Ruminococcus sp. Marseille-P6503]|uniref:zinc finger protein n=1 Tax=Ruminococcus sp. Marseille-P6503 TaxID=2364796 RepID=UPI000F530179|nr:zinc finger protein [Ruminococcus sp. Marseille-P6503]
MSWKCSKCGNINDNDSEACVSCGSTYWTCYNCKNRNSYRSSKCISCGETRDFLKEKSHVSIYNTTKKVKTGANVLWWIVGAIIILTMVILFISFFKASYNNQQSDKAAEKARSYVIYTDPDFIAVTLS